MSQKPATATFHLPEQALILLMSLTPMWLPVSSSVLARGRTVPEDLLELPGYRVDRITPHGSSFWTQTAHLETTSTEGSPKSFFLKVAQDEQGRRMMHGEFESMSALYAIVPDFVPKPYAWGSYRDIEGVHFFLCDFQSVALHSCCPTLDNPYSYSAT